MRKYTFSKFFYFIYSDVTDSDLIFWNPFLKLFAHTFSLGNQYSIICKLFYSTFSFKHGCVANNFHFSCGISIYIHTYIHINSFICINIFFSIMLCSDIYYYNIFFLFPHLFNSLNILRFTNYLFLMYLCQALHFSPISIFNAHINMSAITHLLLPG